MRFQVQLRVGEQHAQLRTGQRLAALHPLHERLQRRQLLGLPVQLTGPLETGHETPEVVGRLPGSDLVQGDRHALRLVVLEHQRGHGVGEVLQERVALAHRRVAPGIQEDLEVHLPVRQVHATRVVQRVRVDPPAV